MYKSKLLDLIRVFEKAELEEANKFLCSPYFKKAKTAKEVLLLWNLIFSCFPNFEDSRLDKERAYIVLYPNQTFVPGRIDRVMSDLVNRIKDFISFEFSDLKRDESQRLLVLARFYRERQMEKPFRQSIKALRKRQLSKERDRDTYLKQYLIELEISRFDSFYNNRKENYNVPATLRSLNIFYLVHKLEYSCWLLTQDTIIQDINIPQNITRSLRAYEQFIDSFKQELNFEEVPILKVYDHGIRLIHNKEDGNEIFQELKQALEEYALEIPIDRLKELQTLCRNYCILEYNKGNESYLEEVFSLQRKHLEQGYLLYEGGLIPSTFRNIVVFGLRLKEFDWVYQFLKEYKDRIIATNQASEIYLFNLATYYFAIKKYEKALDCLTDRYEDIYYLLAAKRMELKVYYELEHDVLESKIDAFKIYIYRISKKNLPESHRDANNNFIDILRQIRSSKTLANKGRIEKIANKIKIKVPLSEKKWLLEKIEYLN